MLSRVNFPVCDLRGQVTVALFSCPPKKMKGDLK